MRTEDAEEATDAQIPEPQSRRGQNGAMTTESPSSPPALPDHEIPTLEVGELRDLQLERLRRTVRTAYDNVPHYRRPLTPKVSIPMTCSRSTT